MQTKRGDMKIVCRNCGFSIETRGEGFFIREEDLKYCLKCGKSYIETGVDVAKIYDATDTQIKCQSRIVSIFGLLPALLYLTTSMVLISRNVIHVGPENFGRVLFLAALPPILWMVIVVLIALRKGNKKFEEMAGS